MQRKDPIQRARVTKATKRRDENLKTLIEILRTGQAMTSEDMQHALGFSASGARKYANDLLAAEVTFVIRTIPGPREHLGKPVYKLSADESKIDAFLNSIAERDGGYEPKTNPARRPRNEVEGSHIHTLRDDVHFTVKRAPTKIPKADPLLAALFGRATTAK